MDIRPQQKVATSVSLNNENGFTLVEIIFAVLLLGGGLAILLGLQSSITQKALRDRNQRQAMLMARSILSAIEIDPEEVEPQSVQKPALQMLADFIQPENRQRGQQDDEQQTNIEYQAALDVSVETVLLPVQDPTPIFLKKIVLSIFWSDDPRDSFQTFLFIPALEESG